MAKKGYVQNLLLLILIFCIQSLQAKWPTDKESYGFLGCKQLQFRGMWENDIDSSKLDESTDGICITVSLANILLYYQWPLLSHFDGVFITDSNKILLKRINHNWNFNLITGRRTTSDCESDDPESRHLPNLAGWTGVQEIRKLVYVIERSFGFNHDYFRVPDDSICYGTGYYAVEHVLRNRFGYPLCKTIDARKEESKQKVIQNLKNNMPVIAMRCDHVYLLDGYRYDPKKGRDLIHSSDYLQLDASMGWFPWKYFYNEGLEQFVIDISPRFRLLKGPSGSVITYTWGEGVIPGTKFTSRSGRIVIWREKELPIGNIELALETKHNSSLIEKNKKNLLMYKGNISSRQLIIPPEGYFDFNVEECTMIVLHIKNHDPWAKNLRIVFHDFAKTI